ncbi:MAG: cytochrome-c peroxidase [Hyphomicrobiaceae bacterium]
MSLRIVGFTSGITAAILAISVFSTTTSAERQEVHLPQLPKTTSKADFVLFSEMRARIGRLLFYDKVLSGNRNISCGTCHNHEHAGSDGLSLGIGEGGIGVGPHRRIPRNRDMPDRRLSRNSPALFNLGHRDIKVLFHDGRLTRSDIYGNGFNSPAGRYLPRGLSGLIAAQAMLPVASAVEMAGNADENDVGAALRERVDYVWPILAKRVARIDIYADRFAEAFEDINDRSDIKMAHVANAIADFVNSEWRSFDSPFDHYLKGDRDALSTTQLTGMKLFFGAAQCASCHSGPMFSDQAFHGLAIPPYGPGRIRMFDPYARDVGRMSETDLLIDAYRFRTPSLRNVAVTGPWGHNGAYSTLEGIVRHHLDPLLGLGMWNPAQVVLPYSETFGLTDFAIWQDSRELARLKRSISIDIPPRSPREVAALVAFLKGLTGRNSVKGRLGKPRTVPSGLPVD